MRLILHIGAHRTGTTSFQSYMRRHSAELSDAGIGFWGPVRTRKGLFSGIQPTPGLGLSLTSDMSGRCNKRSVRFYSVSERRRYEPSRSVTGSGFVAQIS